MACRGSGVRVPSPPPTRRARTARARASSHLCAPERRSAHENRRSESGRWHHGPMTATDLSTSTVSERTAAHIATTERYAAHNYHPLPVVLAEGDGAWVVDVDGNSLPRLPGGLLRAQLRALQRAPGRRRARAAGPPHPDQPGVLQQPAQHLRRGAGPPDRQGHDPADELRRRGRRDRDQGQPQVGLRGQGRARRPGLDRHHGGQLPRPHHHDRQLLRRRGRDLRLRPLHLRLPQRGLRRHRGRSPRRSTTPPSRCSSSRSRARAAS